MRRVSWTGAPNAPTRMIPNFVAHLHVLVFIAGQPAHTAVVAYFTSAQECHEQRTIRERKWHKPATDGGYICYAGNFRVVEIQPQQ